MILKKKYRGRNNYMEVISEKNKCLQKILRKYIFVEVFVDSHAVLKSNTEVAQVLLTQFLPMLIFCRTRVQYHNQDTDTIHLSFSDFPSFMCLCEGVCISHDCLI